MLLGIKWYQFVRNDYVQRLTNQPKLTAIIRSCRLTVWAYYAHRWQCRCQEDSVSLPSGGLEKTTRSSPHHVAQHHPTGSETPPPYIPLSRFGSELPSVEDDVDVRCYSILELHARNDDDNVPCCAIEVRVPLKLVLIACHRFKRTQADHRCMTEILVTECTLASPQ